MSLDIRGSNIGRKSIPNILRDSWRKSYHFGYIGSAAGFSGNLSLAFSSIDFTVENRPVIIKEGLQFEVRFRSVFYVRTLNNGVTGSNPRSRLRTNNFEGGQNIDLFSKPFKRGCSSSVYTSNFLRENENEKDNIFTFINNSSASWGGNSLIFSTEDLGSGIICDVDKHLMNLEFYIKLIDADPNDPQNAKVNPAGSIGFNNEGSWKAFYIK